MNKKKKDIMVVVAGLVLAITPWTHYEITGDISYALYGLAIDMALIALALMDCIADLRKTIKGVIKNDNENND